MTPDNPPPIDGLFQLSPGTEHCLRFAFGQRGGQARLYSGEQFTLIDSRFEPAPQPAVWRHQNQGSIVELNFVLEGYLRQTHSGLLQQQAYVAGYHNLLFNPDSLEENELVGGKAFQMLSIQVEMESMTRLLVDYAPELEPLAQQVAQRIPFVRQSPVLAYPEPVMQLLKTLWQSPTSSGLKRLHFESVGLFLLSYAVDRLSQGGAFEKPAGLTPTAKAKLYYARDLLVDQLSDPPGLRQLAKACELNEFSLKKGFKALFGTTVYGFVLQRRMEAARIALYSGEKTVTQLAYELGYAHPQHFHRVFKQYYGVTPRSVKLA